MLLICARADLQYTGHVGLISEEWWAYECLLESDLSSSIYVSMSARELMIPSRLQIVKLYLMADACQAELLRPRRKCWGGKKLSHEKWRGLETVVCLEQNPAPSASGEKRREVDWLVLYYCGVSS